MNLDTGEKIDLDGVFVYTRQWCDGKGNLGPCMCADDNKVGRGHWRSGRRVPLSEVLKLVAEKQNEACAERAVSASGWSDIRSYVRATPLAIEENK